MKSGFLFGKELRSLCECRDFYFLTETRQNANTVLSMEEIGVFFFLRARCSASWERENNVMGQDIACVYEYVCERDEQEKDM